MTGKRKKDKLKQDKHQKHQKQAHEKKLKDEELGKIHGGGVVAGSGTRNATPNGISLA